MIPVKVFFSHSLMKMMVEQFEFYFYLRPPHSMKQGHSFTPLVLDNDDKD